MLIKFENILKLFGTKEALSNLSFEVHEHSAVALVGNNGCGKSTTIHALCNLVGYDKGELRFEGRKITPDHVTYKRQLGILLSKPYYIEDFNVPEYWEFVCRFQEVPRKDVKRRIADLIVLLELEEYAQKPIRELSSGNQMKVSLGGALIHNPKMLVLDEPFINLDIRTTDKVMNILKGFSGKKTILITSHQLELVADLCDRFLIMDNGQIVSDLEKKDFESSAALKDYVRRFLAKEDDPIDLGWLK